MPVFRGDSQSTAISQEAREGIIDQIGSEISGSTSENGPVIFEIPLKGMDKYDVLVVWEEWETKQIPSESRGDLIAEAYKSKSSPIADHIALTLGATYAEALDQHLLPYGIVPNLDRFVVPNDKMVSAMKKRGAFRLPKNRLDLRFPTLEMAHKAHKQLVDEIPEGYWSIVQ